MQCPRCKHKMEVRDGKYGKFWACPHSTPCSPHPTKSIKKKNKDTFMGFVTEEVHGDIEDAYDELRPY